MSKSKIDNKLANLFATPNPPGKCTPVVVIPSPYGDKVRSTYHGVVKAYAKDADGVVKFVQVEPDSVLKFAAQWESVHDVFEVD